MRGHGGSRLRKQVEEDTMRVGLSREDVNHSGLLELICLLLC